MVFAIVRFPGCAKTVLSGDSLYFVLFLCLVWTPSERNTNMQVKLIMYLTPLCAEKVLYSGRKKVGGPFFYPMALQPSHDWVAAATAAGKN